MRNSGSGERTVTIRGEIITLGQLVKLLDFISMGGEVREYLARTKILVNGEAENRRGRKLRDGDVIVFPGQKPVRIVGTPEA
jgi:ribosome-associated protein